MKKTIVILSFAAIWVITLLLTSCEVEDQALSDLSGEWEVEWMVDGTVQPPLHLNINEMQEIPDKPGKFYAVGCMRSSDQESYLPLSLEAIPGPDSGKYDVRLYGTVFLEGEMPQVVLLTGEIETKDPGIKDDQAGGAFKTETSIGEWSGTHLDSRISECALGGFGEFIQADVRLHKSLSINEPVDHVVFELYTAIVSSSLQIEQPDGSVRVVHHYTDIFSPEVDFVGNFRYIGWFENESPVVGEPYHFVLLDLFGDAIPGTESTDAFWRCTQDAPRSLRAMGTFGADIELSWDPVPAVPGEFEPEIQEDRFHAPYQINIHRVGDDPVNIYGAVTTSPVHIIPWGAFEPSSAGTPDGVDFGQPLSEFEPGLYEIVLDSWNMPIEDQGGHFQDCSVTAVSEALYMEILDGEIIFKNSP